MLTDAQKKLRKTQMLTDSLKLRWLDVEILSVAPGRSLTVLQNKR